MSLGALAITPLRALVLAAIGAIGIAIALQPAPAAAPQALRGLAVVAVTIMLWATAVLPAWASGFAFFALALVSAVAPPLAVLSGFWSNAAGLFAGGMLLGAAADRTGLGRWIARGLVDRFIGTYRRFLVGIMIGSGVLSFLVPATMGRLALTIPIVAATARAIGYEAGSKGYYGAMLTTVAGNFLTSFAVLPANLVNVIAVGAVEAQHGPQLQYGEYLLYMLPVLGLAKAIVFLILTALLFPAPPPASPQAQDAAILTPAAKRLAAILALTITLWATDFAHRIAPGWIALGAGIICLLPPLGLVQLRDVTDSGKLTGLLSLAAVLGVATVLTQSGASTIIGTELSRLAAVEGQGPVYGFFAIAIMSAMTSLVATIVGAIATVSPIVGLIGEHTGLPVKMGLVAEITGLQLVCFPYQAVPIMVGLMIARVPAGVAVRLLIPLALTGLVLIPLQAAWLRLLGVL